MRTTTWLIAGITVFFVLILGALGFFALLVGLNGVPESTGGAILLSYLVLVLLAIVFAVKISRWSVTTVPTRTGWPIWTIGLLTILSTTSIVAALLVVTSFILIVAFGLR